jgi:hypothetical protein
MVGLVPTTHRRLNSHTGPISLDVTDSCYTKIMDEKVRLFFQDRKIGARIKMKENTVYAYATFVGVYYNGRPFILKDDDKYCIWFGESDINKSFFIEGVIDSNIPWLSLFDFEDDSEDEKKDEKKTNKKRKDFEFRLELDSDEEVGDVSFKTIRKRKIY